MLEIANESHDISRSIKRWRIAARIAVILPLVSFFIDPADFQSEKLKIFIIICYFLSIVVASGIGIFTARRLRRSSGWAVRWYLYIGRA